MENDSKTEELAADCSRILPMVPCLAEHRAVHAFGGHQPVAHAFMERILLVAQCIVLAVWALPYGAAGLNGMAALKTLVLRLRGGQEKKANAV